MRGHYSPRRVTKATPIVAPEKYRYANTGNATSEATADIRANQAWNFDRQFDAHW
jgi:hypothetical protein